MSHEAISGRDDKSHDSELGATVGVEEEYHLINPDTFALTRCPGLITPADGDRLGEQVHAEMLTTQLEAVTPVCRSLDEVHAALVCARRLASSSAAAAGAVILAASTHPSAAAAEIELTPLPRYDRLADRFGDILRINLCGCHIHVGVPNLDMAVRISNLARDYLPLLVALSGSSPFYAGRDTGYDSFRIPLLEVLPQAGAPPVFESAQHFRQTVANLQRHGLVEDATGVLWLVRPSARYPTIEFRVADVCADVRDVLLLAAVTRSLVRMLGARIAAGGVESMLPDRSVRAACWHAARYGTTGTLWSPSRRNLVPAMTALADLMAELRPFLVEHGERGLVEELWTRRVRVGGPAARQRQVFAATGSLSEVVRDGVELTARTG